MSTGHLLLDEPNPHGPHHYTTRRGSVLACVVHITAGLQGRPDQADSSAERTARYAATTDRPVSWHSGSDTDSWLQLLPDSYTAFHVRGYNSRTIGHEISKRDVRWADEDPVWVADTLQTAAACLRPRLARLGIPLRHASRAELDRAIATGGPPVGLIGHSRLDPARRQDPGPDFPWARFLDLLAGPASSSRPPSAPSVEVNIASLPVLTRGAQGALVKRAQVLLAGVFGHRITADGDFGPVTERALRAVQAKTDVPVTGKVDLPTWYVLIAARKPTAKELA